MNEGRLTPKDVLAAYSSGQRDFRHVDVEDSEEGGASFRHAVLDGADFSGSFVFADFSDASLRGCRFQRANIKTCVFDRADLSCADFRSALIDAATFQGARLEGSNFGGATAYGHVFKEGEFPD